MTGQRPVLSPPWLAAAAVLTVAAGLGAWTLAGEDDPPPATTTTTTTTTEAPDPTDDLVVALAERLSAEAGIEPDPPQLRCLAHRVLDVLDDDRLADLQGAPVDAETLAPTERAAMTRAVVECLGPNEAEALLGEGTTTTTVLAQLPDEGDG